LAPVDVDTMQQIATSTATIFIKAESLVEEVYIERKYAVVLLKDT
jgi:hypothetical protein